VLESILHSHFDKGLGKNGSSMLLSSPSSPNGNA
jgi:hypothetical protein